MTAKIRIGALISGSGTNLQAIIDSCESEKINGKIVFVGSDTPGVYGLERAVKHNIPIFVTNYFDILKKYKQNSDKLTVPSDFNFEDIKSKQSLFQDDYDINKVKSFLTSRAIAESALFENIKKWDFDLLVLAGFMRILTPYFIDKVNADPLRPRIMNIHPALLPSFPGTDGYGDTFRYGCKVGGCTVHFIDYGEDSGQIIGQKAFDIEPDDTIDSIKEKGLKVEWELYPECIQLFAKNRLKVEGRVCHILK